MKPIIISSLHKAYYAEKNPAKKKVLLKQLNEVIQQKTNQAPPEDKKSSDGQFKRHHRVGILNRK